MRRKLDELYAIAVANGYTGAKPTTIIGALDALTDSLAGEDIDSGTTVSDAVRAIAPYIGSGSGGAQYGENYASIGYSYTSPLSPDFSTSMAYQCEGAMLWDVVGNKPIALDAYERPLTGGASFLDGTAASVIINGSANESGAVEAALFTYTSVDMETETFTFDVTSYDGITYDSENHRFVIRIHDVPAPLFVEDDNPNGGFNVYPMIVFRVIENVTPPSEPI